MKEEIIKTILEFYRISRDELRSKSRKPPLLEARQMLHYFLKQKGLSLSACGRETHRGHATVLNSLRRFEQYRETEPAYRRRINILDAIIESQ